MYTDQTGLFLTVSRLDSKYSVGIRSPHKDWVKLDLVDILVLEQRTTG